MPPSFVEKGAVLPGLVLAGSRWAFDLIETMAEDKKQQLEQKLWNIANTLRGKMDADDFRDYILGFIFYKYLSEKMHTYANEILKPDKIKYEDVERHKDKKATTGRHQGRSAGQTRLLPPALRTLQRTGAQGQCRWQKQIHSG